MDLYIFQDRQIVGGLMRCTFHPDPRADAPQSGFIKGEWPGFLETTYADPETWAQTEYVLGDDTTGDLYRQCRIYPTHTQAETVTFWYRYCQRRNPPAGG
jgi:hypothetical protein